VHGCNGLFVTTINWKIKCRCFAAAILLFYILQIKRFLTKIVYFLKVYYNLKFQDPTVCVAVALISEVHMASMLVLLVVGNNNYIDEVVFSHMMFLPVFMKMHMLQQLLLEEEADMCRHTDNTVALYFQIKILDNGGRHGSMIDAYCIHLLSQNCRLSQTFIIDH
jgi:hypothetical protein